MEVLSLLRSVHTSRHFVPIEKFTRNTQISHISPTIKRFPKFIVLHGLKTAVQLIGIVFEALSAIITPVRATDDRVTCWFHHCEGGSWPTTQTEWHQWTPEQVAASGVCHRIQGWASCQSKLLQQVVLLGDIRVSRIREVRDIEKREVGRLHCTNILR